MPRPRFWRFKPLFPLVVGILFLVGLAGWSRAETLPVPTDHGVIQEFQIKREAGFEYIADELIVKYRGDAQPFRTITIPRGQTVWAVRRELLNRHEIEYAEPNYIAHALYIPNDPYFPIQWNFDNPVNGGVHAQSAWDVTRGAESVVAVADTGIAYENYRNFFYGQRYYQAPDLKSTCFVPGYDFVEKDSHPNDDNAHGTHVAGTIAQTTNNTTGVAGLAFESCLQPIKVLDRNGTGTYANIAAGIRYAADHGANVINLSLGGSVHAQTLLDAVAYAYQKGVTIVAAAGNDGRSGLSYPAAYDDYVIAVGATRFDQTLTSYSNYGTSLDVVAPGGDLSVDQNGDGYGDGILQNTFNPNTKARGSFGYWFFEGTSMATPHVAAIAALVRSHGNASTPDEIRQAIEQTASDRGTPGRDDQYGWGLVNAAAALDWSGGDVPPGNQITVDLKVNNSDGPLTIAGGSNISVSWITESNPTDCTASGGWSGAKNPAGGTEQLGPLGGPIELDLILDCTDGTNTVSDIVSVTVEAPIQPPGDEIEVFADSFEISEWNGLWTEDFQNDWYRSWQRSTEGRYSAEVDGSASDASLLSIPINLQGKTNARITFDWLIESGLDTGEYLVFDLSSDGGLTWTQAARLSGNVDQENVWHHVTIEQTGLTQLQLRFRGKMSGSSEDADVDSIRVVAF